MKRICRQHGILRWPFRKMSKLNRSLHKINRVVHSVNCSPAPAPAPMAAASSSYQQAPASSHPPCMSTALAMASSQGSCQAPPLANAAAAAAAGGGVVTVKASYRGDIVRFRVPCSAGVAAVKEEVAKRLGLEAGAFDVKYLDDDHEWVLLSCDDDFQECLDVVPALPPAPAAAQVVRLMVQEVVDSIGSSCGSSD